VDVVMCLYDGFVISMDLLLAGLRFLRLCAVRRSWVLIKVCLILMGEMMIDEVVGFF